MYFFSTCSFILQFCKNLKQNSIIKAISGERVAVPQILGITRLCMKNIQFCKKISDFRCNFAKVTTYCVFAIMVQSTQQSKC